VQIGNKDVLWNYIATFLKIGSSVLLLPFILRMMTPEMVGIWSVFMTVSAFAFILDFGFNSSFTRNVTYILGGVKKLRTNGFETIDKDNLNVDYGLLKSIIAVMRWFYLRLAIVTFILLMTLGTYYIFTLLQNYTGKHLEVYLAWLLLCLINTYNIYTLYYDSLLQGRGFVKKSKQITVIGQLTYLVIASILISSGFGLVALVSAQISSVLIIRWLSYNCFFTSEIKQNLQKSIPHSQKEVLRTIYPNAIKIGLASFGVFMGQRSAIIIGSFYLSLAEIGAYSITIQIIAIIGSVGSIQTVTYFPKIPQLRIDNKLKEIKDIYIRGLVFLTLSYTVAGNLLLFIGNWGLVWIGSKTQLMPPYIIIVALVLSWEQTNLYFANIILLSKNEVPYYKVSLVSGLVTILFFLLAFQFTSFGLIILVLVPLIIDLFYQGWRWPLLVKNELRITMRDIFALKILTR